MRNPIFAADTVIIDQVSSTLMWELPIREREMELSAGERVVALDTPQALIRITTASGIKLDLTPETAMALKKDALGSPMIWRPVRSHHRLSKLRTISDLDHPDFEAMRFYIAGLICGSGQHLTDRTRASFFSAPIPVAAAVEDMIMALAPKLVEKKFLHEYANRHSAIDLGHGMFYLRSRVLTWLCDDLLTTKSQELLFDLDSTDHLLVWSFLRGLLSTLDTDDDGGIVFYHRHASVVKDIVAALWWRFGVPCSFTVHDHEPISSTMRRPENRHAIRLSAEQIKYAVFAGLRPGEPDLAYAARPIPDQIVSVEPLPDPVKAIAVVGKVECRNDRIYPLAANTVVFESLFSMPSEMTDQSRPALVKDPTEF